MPVQARPVIDRLVDRFEIADGGCWLWQGAKNSMGYGVIGDGRSRSSISYVHRLAYEHAVGRIPAGMVIDHICCTPHCINPDHMEVVPQGENVHRGWQNTRYKKLKYQMAVVH